MNSASAQPRLWQRSTIRRFLLWVFRWRTLGVIGFLVFCLVTLAFLVLAEENWRGKQAWENFRQKWEAKGERFDLASFIPKQMPPDQNFAMTPFLAPLLDYGFTNGTVRWNDSNGVTRAKSVTLSGGETYWPTQPSLGGWQRGEFCDLKVWQEFYRSNTNFPVNPQPKEPARDVLFALQKYDAVLTELRAAAQRPYASFPVHYDDGSGLLLLHLSVLKAVSQVAEFRALASLEAGHSEDALADVKLAFSFARSLQSEPMLISHLVRLALIQIAIQPVWEGLAKHRWTDAELEELQQTLASFYVLEDYGHAMRSERAFSNQTMAQMRSGRVPGQQAMPTPLRILIPTGLLYQNQLVIDRLYQETTLPAVDAAQHRVYPEKCGTNILESVLRKHTPYNMFAWMTFPAIGRSAEKFARGQNSVDLAAVACALERCRLAHGQYPDTLDPLAPQFMTKLPLDIMNGQPLKYRRTDDGQFVLYSVGWDQKDDGGTVEASKGNASRVNISKGDWVWHYPRK